MSGSRDASFSESEDDTVKAGHLDHGGASKRQHRGFRMPWIGRDGLLQNRVGRRRSNAVVAVVVAISRSNRSAHLYMYIFHFFCVEPI